MYWRNLIENDEVFGFLGEGGGWFRKRGFGLKEKGERECEIEFAERGRE